MPKLTRKSTHHTEMAAWFTRVCMWLTVRLICFRARVQRSGTRNRERREADYEYEHECDSYAESCNPELNQAEMAVYSDKVTSSGRSISRSSTR